jgi:hypothetical protein
VRESFEFGDEAFKKNTDRFETIIAESEGALGIEGIMTVAAWDWQKNKFSSVLDGHGGQIWRRTILKVKQKQIEREGNIAEGVRKYFTSQHKRSSFLLPEVSADSERLTRKALQQYFSSLGTKIGVGDQIDRFFIDQVCNNKYSQAGGVEMGYVRLVHPLLNQKAAEYLSRIPDDFRAKNAVYVYLIKSLYPELAKFPVEMSGHRVGFNGFWWKRYIPLVLHRYAKPIGNIINPFRPITTVDMVMKFGRTKAEKLLAENLHLIKDYVDVGKVEQNLQDTDVMTSRELAVLTNFALLVRYLSEI